VLFLIFSSSICVVLIWSLQAFVNSSSDSPGATPSMDTKAGSFLGTLVLSPQNL
jgi:hypothetical protein